MTKFIIRRALQAIPTLFGITVIAFAIMSLAPGGPTTALGFNPELTARQRAAMAEALGVNDPWYIQYFRWLLGDGAYIIGGQPAWRVDANMSSPDGTYYIFDVESGELLESGSAVTATPVEFENPGIPAAEVSAAQADGLAITADDLEALTPEIQGTATYREGFFIENLPLQAWRVTVDDTYYVFDGTSGALITQGDAASLPDELVGEGPDAAPTALHQSIEDVPDLLADVAIITEDVVDAYEDAVDEAEDNDQPLPAPPYTEAAFLPEYTTPAWRIISEENFFFLVSALNPEAVLERGSALTVRGDRLSGNRMGYGPSLFPETEDFPVTTAQLPGLLTEASELNRPQLDEFTYLPNYGGFVLWHGRTLPVFDNAANPIGERMGDHFGILRGDFGESAISQRPAMEVVLERLPATAELGVLSLAIGLVIGVIIGVLAAVFHDSWFDQVTRILAVLVSSIPVYWLGLILLLIFGSYLGWLPMGGRFPNTISGEYTTWERVSRLILPVFTLSSFGIATFSRYMRASLLDVLEQDYIRTAHAKGVPERVVWFKHGMRNALIPIATILGPSLTLVISGAVLTETIYSWPGMGRLLVNSVFQADYNIIMAVILLLAFATILGYMLSDILYALFDPRVRLN
ncbi:MAG: ABC transporter permease subunit [Chloroflexota bacterium]